MTATILQGDCIEEMAKMPDASIDAVVCDPPYGLEFMGKEWDRLGPVERHSDEGGGDRRAVVDSEAWMYGQESNPYSRSRVRWQHGSTGPKAMQKWHEVWAREALRVLKPGGHLLAFGGTRTYHRLACALEDAGFEIRDSLMWLYGSGFPKSLDVSKAIDKAAGAEREVVGKRTDGRYAHGFSEDAKRAQGAVTHEFSQGWVGDPTAITAPATPDAEKWQGWGTALKPAHEPIVVARKPLAGTVASNALAHGTGALNVDGCRIGAGERPVMVRTETVVGANSMSGTSTGATSNGETTNLGRWPANVVLSHVDGCEQIDTRRETEVWECVPGCPVGELDRQSGTTTSTGGSGAKSRGALGQNVYGEYRKYDDGTPHGNHGGLGDVGGASRFFYVAKAGRAERNAGLQAFDEEGNDISVKNAHPTVKPVSLMRWLVRLVTPPGGTVLDPFTGSGTTGIAAKCEGFNFVGIERDAEYVPIARARIKAWQSFRKGTPRKPKQQITGQGQMSLE